MPQIWDATVAGNLCKFMRTDMVERVEELLGLPQPGRERKQPKSKLLAKKAASEKAETTPK